MARKYESAEAYERRVIEAEIDRHQREYERAQERWAWSASRSPEDTMRRHDILGNALAAYLRSRREAKARSRKLSDISDLVTRKLKVIEDGFEIDTKDALLTIKRILEGEYD